ncbi:sphingolipid c9-methyltransferase [Phaffia rhodozyma]|uniref:sphingolipid C(9)-methyltransferase n=1 Tax=Phaffia rhodozyma TaxID=264483 RepID=A0A0F7SU23_PHARH|nr:sphingolipid c9-methyltransferase [Phaffia rhodozyma]
MVVKHPHVVADGVVAPSPLPAEGSGAFSNLHLALAVIITPKLIQWTFPILNHSRIIYFILLAITFFPVLIGYWTLTSTFGGRINDKVQLPGRPIGHYLEFKDEEVRKKYLGRKIPYQELHDLYFEGKIDFKGDVLEVLEYRHDFVTFNFTPELFKYVFFTFAPEVILHSQSQDEEQVRGHYDRGDDFYEWFLGPRMIYTSGVISDITRPETLEELQDNKLKLVCEKLDLQPTDKLLDIGCGWGTLVAFAGKNYKCDVTGVTLGINQTKFGTERLRENGVPEDRGRILCTDYRFIDPIPQSFTKIVSLEMAEHVGIRKYSSFLRQVYDLLDDDGTFVFQVAGIRPSWQFEDLQWGLFMNKYVFPGADASIPLWWVLKEVEAVGFEVKQVDVLGVHYSATIYRWYQNWISNKEKVLAKYGDRWFRIWSFFLASSTIVSRQGSASVFQITLHKNLNAYKRVEGVPTHIGIHYDKAKEFSLVQ